MVNPKISKIIVGLALVILGAGALSLAYLLPRSRAQADAASYLYNQLKLQGVPVVSVSTKSQLPIQADVEIVLQSKREDGKINAEELWNVYLARREASLAYRNGYPIKSYALIVLNSRGESIKEGVDFLSPDSPSQQPFHVAPKKLDNERAKKLILERMDLHGFSLDSLDVITGSGSLADVQIAVLLLSTPNISQANATLAEFMLAIEPFFESLNAEDGVRIAVVKLRLVDQGGKALLDYIMDMEIGQKSWVLADGVTKSWFPHPPEISPTETVPGEQSGEPYPPPATPTPTFAPTPVPTAYP